MRIVAISIAVALGARPALGEVTCAQGRLPAYAHNDYANTHPLEDALRLGFRGVEADVFLIEGVLRLGHSRRQAKSRGADFEATYLVPLARLAQRCSGRLTSDGTPFLLTVELKEQSPPTLAALVAALGRHPVLTAAHAGARPPIEVVLVGWHPRADALTKYSGPLGLQYLVSGGASRIDASQGARVRLLSINYGKVIRRRWRRDVPPAVWQAELAALHRVYPGARVRAFNVPTDDRLYKELLDAGVDLIGTEEVDETARLLGAYGSAP